MLLPPAAQTMAPQSNSSSSGLQMADGTTNERISGGEYRLTQEEIDFFHENGYVSLRQVLTPQEVDEIESVYDDFMSRKIPVPGRDYGDHSQGNGTELKDFNLINVNNPTTHLPEWANHLYERRCRSITRQLYGDGMDKDTDQFLTKLPHKAQALFPWHQDMGYWPRTKRFDSRTATFSLALNKSDRDNGCLRVIPGTHKAKALYGQHGAASTDTKRDGHGDARALELQIRPEDQARIQYLPVERGDATVHDEWIVHGSTGNGSDRPRKTYVMAFRDVKMIEFERSLGFSHSYNNPPEVLQLVRYGKFDDDEEEAEAGGQ